MGCQFENLSVRCRCTPFPVHICTVHAGGFWTLRSCHLERVSVLLFSLTGSLHSCALVCTRHKAEEGWWRWSPCLGPHPGRRQTTASLAVTVSKKVPFWSRFQHFVTKLFSSMNRVDCVPTRLPWLSHWWTMVTPLYYWDESPCYKSVLNTLLNSASCI